MINKKGQALVEFIIIVPVLILIIASIVDYVRIAQLRISLENMLEEVIENPDYKLDSDINLNEVTTDGEISYYLRKNINIYSPFLTVVMKNPYPVEVMRVIYEK